MKLYTEEQVFKMLNRARIRNHRDEELFSNDYLMSNETPIELPSDEEIIDNAPDDTLPLVEFIAGAKWVIEQIKQQENGK